MAKKVARLEFVLRCQDTRTNERGNVIHDWFAPAERYLVDFAPDFSSEGWEQFDTDQDAHYFGVWVNPVKELVLTYAEGDWSLIVCKDYYAEIRSMIEFYGEGMICKAIDTETGTVTKCVQDRAKFLEEA